MEKTGNDVIYYIRNELDDLVGFEYNGEPYYYIKNIQNDIIGFIDKNNKVVARYTYDSLGNLISMTNGEGQDVFFTTLHIAHKNHFRYRGYYFDEETQMYYLNSRYYNPTYGRFINSDNYVSTDTGILGYNMYAYCNNNFINYSDVSGNGFFVALGIIAVGVAVVSYVNTEYRSRKAQKEIAKVQQKPNVPDKTKEIDAELKKNATQIVNDTQAQLTPHKLYTFINDTKSGSKYDLKQTEEWKNQTVSYRGMVLEPQDIGNLNFGYIGRAMGYNVDFLTMGAGAYQLATNYDNPVTYLNCFSATFCDNPRDTYYIRMGAIIYDSQN